MGMFGSSTKISQATSQGESQAAGSLLRNNGWTVRKSTTTTGNLFNLAVIASGLYLYYAWQKKHHKGR